MWAAVFRVLLRLPFSARRRAARLFALWRIAADAERSDTVRANLAVAFSRFSEKQLARLESDFNQATAEVWFDSFIAFAGGPSVVRTLVRLEGAHLLRTGAKPCIVTGAHFVDSYLALLRVAMEVEGAMIYRRPTNPSQEARLLRQVARFSDVRMIASTACIRPALAALRAGMPLAIMADQPDDLRSAVATPFLCGGIAWSPAVAFLAQRTGARVLWLDVERQDDGRYLAVLSPLTPVACEAEREVFAGLATRLQASALARPAFFRWDRGQLLSRRKHLDQSAAKMVQISRDQSSLAK